MESGSEAPMGSSADGTNRGRTPGSRKTQFKKGTPPGRRPTVGDGGRGKDAPLVQFKCLKPKALVDLERAYGKPAHTDTLAVKRLREEFSSDPVKFLKMMNDLQAEHEKARSKAKAAVEGGARVEELPVLEQEAKLIGVIDRLLSGYKS